MIVNMPMTMFQAIAGDSHHFRCYDRFRPRRTEHRLWPDGAPTWSEATGWTQHYQSILPISQDQFEDFPAGRAADATF
jgi:hypothetical protein